MITRRFFTKLNQNKFPFINNGIISDLNENLGLNNFLNHQKNNFKEAIDVYLESIQLKDKQFLKEICEENLYNNIIKSIDFDDEILLKKEDITNLKFVDLSINFNIHLNRLKNINSKMYLENQGEFFKLNLFFNHNAGIMPNLNNFLKSEIISRITIEYETKSKFYLKEEEIDIDNSKHLIHFDSLYSMEEFNKKFKLKDLFLEINKIKKNELMGYLKSLLNNWYISDSDNFLNGNDLLSLKKN